MKPRVLMVGRTRYRLPLNESLARKFDALGERLDLRVLAAAPRGASAGDDTFALQRGTPVAALDAPAFYGSLPVRIARELRREPADAILAQSPYEALAAFAGRSLARSDAAVVVEIHGDWRTWSRLYGSRARAVVAPLADRAALVAIRGADAVRTLSPFTTGIVRDAGVEPAGVFTTYTELTAFSEPPVAPLPDAPVALFIGVAERYKNIHAIAEAWRLAAPRVPGRDPPARRRRPSPRRPGGARARPSRPRHVGSATRDVRRRDGVRRLLAAASRVALRGHAPRGARGAVPRPCRGRGAGRRDPRRRRRRRDRGPRRPRPARTTSPTGSSASSPTARWRERLGEGGRALSASWTYTPEEYADRVAELVGTRRGGAQGVRLVVVTQQVDPASPVLGATVAKLRALAARVDELVVLADSAVDGALPDNCRVRLFRSGHRAGRGLRFESALSRELARRPRPRAVLAHMCPIYAVLAAPVARPLRVPVLLWFTHWRREPAALDRRASLESSCSASTSGRSRMRSKKVVAIGHGIDVSDLPCVERPTRDELTLLALGRTSPSKGLETIIRAVALVPDVKLLVIGPSLTEEERLHKIALERLVIDLGLLDRVDIRHAVPRHTVPGLYAEVDALVNDMRDGRGRQGRLRGGRDLHARPRLESRPSTRCCRRSSASRRGDVDGARAGDRRAPERRPRRGRPLRSARSSSASIRSRRGPTGSSISRGDAPGRSTSRRSRGSPARRTTCSCCCPRSGSAASTSSS